MTILWEVLKGIMYLFINPVFYLAIAAVFFVGSQRVKGERLSFGVRVYGIFNYVFANLGAGLVTGAALTVVTIVIGLSLPFGMLVLISAIYLLLAITARLKYISISLSVSLATLIAFFMPNNWAVGVSLIDSWVQDIHNVSYLSLGFLLIISGLLEGVLFLWRGHRMTSPRLINSKRGKKVGAHDASQVWPVPIFILVPDLGNISPVGLWPVIPVGDFGLVLFPFIVGLQQLIIHSLPVQAVKKSGRWMVVTGVITAAVTITGLVLANEIIVILSAIPLLVGRLALTALHRFQRENKPFYYTNDDNGLKVVAVIPGTPASKLDIKAGETIRRVNGRAVTSEVEFYDSLQINAAYCRMEILNHDGENRVAKTAVHQGIHHKIGLLFLEPSKRVAPRETI